MSNLNDLINSSSLLYSNITRLKTALVNYYEDTEIDENSIPIDISIQRVIDIFEEVENGLLYEDEDLISFMKEEIESISEEFSTNSCNKLINYRFNIISKELKRYWSKLGFANLRDIEISKEGAIILNLPCHTGISNGIALKSSGFNICDSSHLEYHLVFDDENVKLLKEVLDNLFSEYSNLTYDTIQFEDVYLIDKISLRSRTKFFNFSIFTDRLIEPDFSNYKIKNKIEDIEEDAKFIRDLLKRKNPYLGYELDIRLSILKSKLIVLFRDLKSQHKFNEREDDFIDQLNNYLRLERNLYLKSVEDGREVEKDFLNNLSKWWEGLGFTGRVDFKYFDSSNIIISLPAVINGDWPYNFDYLDPDKTHKEILLNSNNLNGLIQIIKVRYPLARFTDPRINIDVNNIATITNINFTLDINTNNN